MKMSKYFFLGLLSLGLVFTGCNDDDDDDDQPTPTPPAENAIVGTWDSYDASPLLVGLGIDSITAEFNSDQTYDVLSYSMGTESFFQGTYEVSEDDVDGIYTITLNQTVPSNATSEGIFEVYEASPDSMWYEVVQIDPALGTAPTASEGFGSSNAGALGDQNIQKYLRR